MISFATLFRDADVWFYVLSVLSLSMFVLKMFFPKLFPLSIVGVLFELGAITERCTMPGLSSNQIVLYILFSIISLVLVYFLIKLIVFIIKRIILSSRDSSKSRKAVKAVKSEEVNFTEQGNMDFSFLVGKEGEVVSDLKPSGKVVIDSKIYDVTTSKEYIYSGAKVKVIYVLAQKIVVKKI